MKTENISNIRSKHRILTHCGGHNYLEHMYGWNDVASFLVILPSKLLSIYFYNFGAASKLPMKLRN